MSERAPSTPGESAEQVHPPLEDVIGYRDGDLAEAVMSRVEQHLGACGPCRARLAAAANVLAQVDLITERPLSAESVEIELLLERLRLQHQTQWRSDPGATEPGFGIRSRPRGGAARVGPMAKPKRKGGAAGAEASGVDAAFAVWTAGDLKTARAMARDLLSQSPSDADRSKLERLVADTSPDPRALHIAFFCLAVVAMVVLLTKLFG